MYPRPGDQARAVGATGRLSVGAAAWLAQPGRTGLPPSPWVPGAAHTLTPNLLLASPEPPVGPRRVARQWYPVATAAAHAGTGALLREEQDQFLQREYFALLISAAVGCWRLSWATGAGNDPGVGGRAASSEALRGGAGESAPGWGARPACREAPGRWLPLPAPVGEAWGAWRGSGAAQGAPCEGSQACALLPPWGPGHRGWLGPRCCRESECGQCWALSALWCFTQGGVPPLGPRELAAAPRPGLAPSLCWHRDRWSALSRSHLWIPGLPTLSSGGCFGMSHRSSELCFLLCFPGFLVTSWESDRRDWPGSELVGGRT